MLTLAGVHPHFVSGHWVKNCKTKKVHSYNCKWQLVRVAVGWPWLRVLNWDWRPCWSLQPTVSNEEITVTLIAVSSPPESFLVSWTVWLVFSVHEELVVVTLCQFFLSLCLFSFTLLYISFTLYFFSPFSYLSLSAFPHIPPSLIRAFGDKRKNNRSHALSPSTFHWAELHWILFLPLTCWQGRLNITLALGLWMSWSTF